MEQAGDLGRRARAVDEGRVSTRWGAAIKAAFEMSPLIETQWTGIANVTAQICARALLDPRIDWMFLYQNLVIAPDVVELALIRQSGGVLISDALEASATRGRFIRRDEMEERVCIWPNIKSAAGRFRREALIVHDLSVLLTPEYHRVDTIEHHGLRLRHDTASSHHLFCVSEATRRDVVAYLSVDEAKTSVLPLGVAFDLGDLSQECRRRDAAPAEPYIAVLGTIEPRKNGGMVIDLLARNPQLARDYQIVFIGRDGWLDEKMRMLDRLREAKVDVGRITFTGFVDDRTKLRLLLNCAFAIYPSFFEGFGLPVLESAVLGKLCVASNTSSLPEVAPDRSIFFDPTDLASLAKAVERAIAITRLSAGPGPAFADIAADVEARGWHRGYAQIGGWVQREAAA